MTTPSRVGDLHIIVAASPSGKISIEHDLHLVKAGILYADRVTFHSPTTSMLLTLATVGIQTEEERILFWQHLLPEMIQDEQERRQLQIELHNYRVLSRKKRLSAHQARRKQALDEVFGTAWSNLEESIEGMLKKADVESLLPAIESGLLNIEIVDSSLGSDAMVEAYVDRIVRMVGDVSSYPLFDEGTAGLISAGIREGKIEVSEALASRGRHVALATELFGRLPLFDLASVGEIVDIRRELAKPLTWFRAAMIRFSDAIQAAVWDDDFVVEAQQVFLRDVAPAIQEIEELIEGNKYLQRLLPGVLAKPVALAEGSLLGLALSQMTSLPTITAQVIGMAAGITVAAIEEYKEWQQDRRQIEGNALFFYYKLGKRL